MTTLLQTHVHAGFQAYCSCHLHVNLRIYQSKAILPYAANIQQLYHFAWPNGIYDDLLQSCTIKDNHRTIDADWFLLRVKHCCWLPGLITVALYKLSATFHSAVGFRSLQLQLKALFCNRTTLRLSHNSSRVQARLYQHCSRGCLEMGGPSESALLMPWSDPGTISLQHSTGQRSCCLLPAQPLWLQPRPYAGSCNK